MNQLIEFFVPNRVDELDDARCESKGKYHLDTECEFDIPPQQQLDDLVRFFDFLAHEKSPTVLLTNPELFQTLYGYVKGMHERPHGTPVTRAARHKICHEIGERLKKLLQVCHAFLKRRGDEAAPDVQESCRNSRKEEKTANDHLLEVCLRSTLKMYAFVLCHVLITRAPQPSSFNDEDEAVDTMTVSAQSQRARRKRRRGDVTDMGFGDDESGVDMDGRELALTSLIEMCSREVVRLWPDGCPEEGLLRLLLKTTLHMITQKANIDNDAQSISSAIALLLARVAMYMMIGTNTAAANPTTATAAQIATPLIELALRSESASLFLCRLVADIEQDDMATELSNKLLRSLFDGLTRAALHDVGADSAAAKNAALFFSEVSRKSVSVTVKMAELIMRLVQSESYDIRKAAITCLAEMVMQCYSEHARSSIDHATRNAYLNELLFRVMDVNAFVRNHAVHTWERLIEAKALPKCYHLAITESLVGRLQDRNYLVRDASMTVISCLLRKGWFGHVLSTPLMQQKIDEARRGAAVTFADEARLTACLEVARRQLQPGSDSMDDLLEDVGNTDVAMEGAVVQATAAAPQMASAAAGVEMSNEETICVNRIVFYESALAFVRLVNKALSHATLLLDSKTERDVVEAIKLIVTCCNFHIEGADTAFLKVLVMVYNGELRIQLAVRDAFAEVIFSTFARPSVSAVTRAMASAQKLIGLLRYATEGEISAVDRIFALLKSNPALSRHLSEQFIDAIWTTAEGSLDARATMEDRRTAMRIYSVLTRHCWRDLRTRGEALTEFLVSSKVEDNLLLAHLVTALQNASLDPQYKPITPTTDPRKHPILRQLIGHLCRPTTSLPTWLCLAEASVTALHCLCATPAVLFDYVLRYVGRCCAAARDANTCAQLFFLVGQTAFKQLVSVEAVERQQLRELEKPARGGDGDGDGGGGGHGVERQVDAMHKELGLGSYEYRRHSIQERARERREAILAPGSIWSCFTNDVVQSCAKAADTFAKKPYERVCSVMALCQLMVVHEGFCKEQLPLLFTIVSNPSELWMVKTNIVVALGDLLCVHPNLLGPFLSDPKTGFFRLLADPDQRVRAVTIQVCSHLVLGDMLRMKDHLHTIVKLVADPDSSIAQNALTFVQNLASKEKERSANLIPPLLTQLSGAMPSDKLQLAMRTLLEQVDGDRPIDSLIERLCLRFEAYSERSKKRAQLAQNIAFCLSELNYTTERAVKRILSEPCYQQYKDWLRNACVYDLFKCIAAKAKKTGRAGGERRDRAIIEEWEARMAIDSASHTQRAEGVDRKGDDGAAVTASE